MPLPLPYYPAHRATQPAYTARPLAPGELPVLVDTSWKPVLLQSIHHHAHPTPTAPDDAVII